MTADAILDAIAIALAHGYPTDALFARLHALTR